MTSQAIELSGRKVLQGKGRVSTNALKWELDCCIPRVKTPHSWKAWERVRVIGGEVRKVTGGQIVKGLAVIIRSPP